MLGLPRRCRRSLSGAGTSLLPAFRRTFAAAPLIAALSAVAACGSGTTDPPATQVARVEVTAAAASVPENESVQLTARAFTASGTVLSGQTFTWQSSNTAIATVDGGGLVRGLARGSATITAAESTSGLGGTLTVTVTPAPVIPGPDPQVTRVEVTAAAASVYENESVQFTAHALTASGVVLSGKTFTWQSGNTAVATVDGSGMVRGVAQGSATITASESTSGVGGALTVTVTRVPVSAVAVSAPHGRVKSGKQLQLSAVLTDAAGGVLTGREITWSTSAPALATVSAGGVLVGKAPGMVTVTAASEGTSGSMTVEVFQLPAAHITLTPPGLKVLAVGETVQLRAVAVDAEGDTISTQLPLSFTEVRRAGAAVLAADEPGVYRGAALGHTTVRAEQGGVSSNTAVVAVLGSGELLAAALPDSTRNRRVGDRVTVPVVLDMSRTASPGDLGALELEVSYDATSLALKSATPGISGSISEGGTPGRYRFAFASSSPTAATRLTIVTLEFEVVATARPGSSVPLTLTFPSAPASTGFAAYPQPVVVNGGVSIAN